MYKGYKQLIVKKQDAILVVKFSNPKKKNSLNSVAYEEIGRVFREVANDDAVTIVVITGVGDFFTSGNDLSASANISDMEDYVRESNERFKRMVCAVIECPKLIIALVNGPCIGIGVTLAGLCDMLWCSETAYFLTPFTKLGIVPESCSSYLFPLIVGRSKATELLLLSQKMSAAEAYHFHFASKVYKPKQLSSLIWPMIKEYSKLPAESLKVSKKLVRMHERESLYAALNAECDELDKRFRSEEFFNALVAFSTRKSKL